MLLDYNAMKASWSINTQYFIYHLCSVYFNSYAIERNICFLTLCDKAFSKRQAYAYLEEVQNEFISQYGSKVDAQTRPYSFIEFGELIVHCLREEYAISC